MLEAPLRLYRVRYFHRHIPARFYPQHNTCPWNPLTVVDIPETIGKSLTKPLIGITCGLLEAVRDGGL